jgi:hypothetical protein
VEEVPQHHGGGGSLDGLCKGPIVVGVLPAPGDEVVQLGVVDLQAIDRTREAIDQSQLGILVRLQEADVETDHAGSVSTQLVHQSGDPGAWPGPASFLVETLLVDHRQNDRRRRLPHAARQETQVVGPQLDQVEDRNAGQVERHDEENGTDRERRGIDGEKGSNRELHDLIC